MARVAGWDFDHRLNGYITTAADTFSCDCGEEFHTPSGYRKCGSCGRAWNSYVIGTDGHGKEASLEKVICREIPVRKDVIVASKRRRNSGKHDSPFQDMYDQHHIHEDAISHPVPELEPSTYPQQPPRMRREVGPAKGEGRHRKQWDPDREQDPFDPRLVGASRRRAKGKCECWEGYERVPGTKPCAKGSCRKCDGHREAMRRYKVGQMSYEDAMAHIDKVLAEGENGKDHSCIGGCGREKAAPATDWSKSRGVPFDDKNKWQFYWERGDSRPEEYGDNIPEHWAPFGSLEHSGFCEHCNPGPARKSAARRYVAWCRQVNRLPNTRGFRRFLTAERIVRSADRHELRRRDLDKIPAEEHDPEDNISIEHFSSRRRAEIFDITEEGDTPKGKGKKSNTPTMRKNPDNWSGHKQNGQFTKRWN